jgi:hypothetical protein
MVAIKDNWLSLRNDLIPAFFNKVALYFIFILFVGTLIFYRKVNKFLLFITVLVFLGIISYFILFYQAFTVHDYYLTNLLIFLPLPIVAILEMLKRNYGQIYHSRILKGFVICAVILLIYETTVITRIKYSVTDKIVKTNFVVGKGYSDMWSSYHFDYKNHFKAYETITPYLRKIGLKRTDRVLCLPDGSINISLYLMDQKGFTAFGYSDLPFDQRMELYKNNGVKFLISDSTFFINTPYLQSYIQSKIGNYRNINIYKLKTN